MASNPERRPGRRPRKPLIRPNARAQRHLLRCALAAEGEVRWDDFMSGIEGHPESYRHARRNLERDGLITVKRAENGRNILSYELTTVGRIEAAEQPVKRSAQEPKTPEDLAGFRNEYSAFLDSARNDSAFLLRLEQALGEPWLDTHISEDNPDGTPKPRTLTLEASDGDVLREAARRLYRLSRAAYLYPRLKDQGE